MNKHPACPLAPGTWLGVLGGGQLGRMFAMAAHRLGYRVAVLDPDPECPAAGAADRLVCAPLDDPQAWSVMAGLCAAVTIETENVPAAALRAIGQRIPVSPDADALAIAQDRIREKRFLAQHRLPHVPFAVLSDVTDARDPALAGLLPAILKTSRFGYDGKGQQRITHLEELSSAYHAMGDLPCVLEQRLALKCELSVIVARSASGESRVFPIPQNRHENGILSESVVPAPLPRATLAKARELALSVALALDYCGVLCVEFFLLPGNRLVVNEIAPRPHNSGHFTLDACNTSQFEQQVRVLAGLPLGDATMQGGAAMINLLGDAWHGGEPDWRAILSQPEARLHLYGKPEARPGRKMGHITFVATSREAARRAAGRNAVSISSDRLSVPAADEHGGQADATGRARKVISHNTAAPATATSGRAK